MSAIENETTLVDSLMTEQPAQKRDIQVITMEIKTLHRQAQQVVLGYAIEIGRRLREAKEQLPHGQWGQWLKTQVEFSQSTANNFMRIFEEYGARQISLFGGEANSQALGNLPYTKALALLAIPEDEREEFVETNKVEELSSRELERMIRERDEARLEAERKEKERQIAESARSKIAEEMQMANSRLEQLNAEVQTASEKRKTLELELQALRDAPIDVAVETVVDQKAVDEAVAKVQSEAKEKLRKAKEKEGQVKAELETLKQKLEAQKAEHDREVEQARAEGRAESMDNIQRLQELEKQVALADPDAQTFKLLFEQTQEIFFKMIGTLIRIEEKKIQIAPKLRAASVAMAEKFLVMAEGGGE